MERHILFCSDFPLGYHNPEAELKLAGFAARGYGATYVEKVGIRNPGPRHIGQILRRIRGGGAPAADRALPFATCSPKLLLPRRAPVIDGLNRRWLARQLLARIPDPAATILWIRYAVPELVPFAERPSWPLVIYEAVDDHLRSPGLDRRLRALLRAAEERILARAGLVLAWSKPIAERLRDRHPNVLEAGVAADLEAFAEARHRTRPSERLAAYAGSLDSRFDADLSAAVARELPDWTFRLAGPVDPAARTRLEQLPNVELAGRIASEEVPRLLAGAAVCLMPYREDAFNDTLFPIKLIEGLASGRPVVSTRILPARAFGDVLALASGPREFASAIRSAAADPAGAAERRVARTEPYGWNRRLDGIEAAIEAALG